MNPNGFGPKNIEKLEMMCQKVGELEINLILLSMPNWRWTISRTENLIRRFKNINKNIEVITTGSGEKSNNTSGWLPDRIIAIVIGRIVGMIEKKTITRDKKEW